MRVEKILEFYKGKNVFVTGHTGFKGSWLCMILEMAGANVTGYALEANTNPSLFYITGIHQGMNSIIGDVRDYDTMKKAFEECKPDVIFHLAAQPIVRVGYAEPRETYSTNVMGTVNLMECIRESDWVKSVVNVTTDKVYRNDRGFQPTENVVLRGFVENDELDGYDPYSNSKSCSELVTSTYKRSFLRDKNIAVSTMRAGNVIGGGDFEKDRIVPDCVRAAMREKKIIVRNPFSVRPFQHVLEPLFAYLMVGAEQYENTRLAGAYNIGPDAYDCVTTGELATMFCEAWGHGMEWEHVGDNGPQEAGILRLNCEKIKNTFHWRPVWNVQTAIEKVVQWSKAYNSNEDVIQCMKVQIRDYMGEQEKV